MATKEQANTADPQTLALKTLSAPIIVGGTMQGATITGSAVAGSMLDVCAATADPTTPLGLATKQYVDNAAPPTPAGSALPTGYILSHVKNNATLPLADIDFSGGSVARAVSDDEDIRLAATLTKKADAAWVAGSGVGGMFTGTFAPNTTYHLFLIYDPVGLVTDAGFDIDVSAANRPAAFTKYRRIASLRTPDASASWPAFIQRGSDFRLKTSFLVYSAVVSTSAVLIDMKIPTQLKLMAFFNVVPTNVATANAEGYASDPAADDQPTGEANAPLGGFGQGTQGTFNSTTSLSAQRIMTDTLARIRFVSTNASTTMIVAILGWDDDRTQGLIPGDA